MIDTVPDNPSEPIRVLHLLEATLGGTLRYLENIADATDFNNVACSLAYGSSRADSRFTPFLRKIEAAGWKTYPVDMRREVSFSRDAKALRAMYDIVRSNNPQIVHCHSSKAGGLGRIAALLQRRSIVRLYSPHALAAPLGAKYLKLEKILSHVTDGFVAVSESERAEIVEHGLARESDVQVVYPSIDVAHFAPMPKPAARQALHLPPGPMILGIGRLTAQKGPSSFVSIVAEVHRIRPDVRAVWLGSGDDELAFLGLIENLGLTGVVQLVPWQRDVRPYIAAADVLLSTSRYESFGYMVAEALAMGIPTVASDVAGTRDLMLGPLCNWLYPAGDQQRAASLLLRLINDESERVGLGQVGRGVIAKEFSSDRMRNDLLRSYRSMLQRKSGAHI